MEFNFSKASDEEIIKNICASPSSADNHISARQEWNRRIKDRESKMLSMTEALVNLTNDMLVFSKRSLIVAFISLVISVFAIIISLCFR
jgi:hypothetical protein